MPRPKPRPVKKCELISGFDAYLVCLPVPDVERRLFEVTDRLFRQSILQQLTGCCTAALSPAEHSENKSNYVFRLRSTKRKRPRCAVQNIHTHTIPRVSKFCFEEWQDIWNCCPGNKLHAIYPVVGTAQHNKIRSRRKAVIINRLRLGHCPLTHSYLMSGDDQPVCESCRLPLTVKHILVDCPNLQDTRLKFFTVSSLKIAYSDKIQMFQSIYSMSV